MSLTSKLALGGSIVFAIATSTYVHLKQKWDRASLREGVIKDMERQEMKKIQNVKMYQDQRELERYLKKQRAQDKKQHAQEDTT